MNWKGINSQILAWEGYLLRLHLLLLHLLLLTCCFLFQLLPAVSSLFFGRLSEGILFENQNHEKDWDAELVGWLEWPIKGNDNADAQDSLNAYDDINIDESIKANAHQLVLFWQAHHTTLEFRLQALMISHQRNCQTKLLPNVTVGDLDDSIYRHLVLALPHSGSPPGLHLIPVYSVFDQIVLVINIDFKWIINKTKNTNQSWCHMYCIMFSNNLSSSQPS